MKLYENDVEIFMVAICTVSLMTKAIFTVDAVVPKFSPVDSLQIRRGL